MSGQGRQPPERSADSARSLRVLYRWPPWLKYLHSTIAVGIATALLLVAGERVEPRHATMLYTLVTGAAAYLFGAGPSLLAGLLSFLALAYLFIEPVGGLFPHHEGDWLLLVAFILVATVRGYETTTWFAMSAASRLGSLSNEVPLGTILLTSRWQFAIDPFWPARPGSQ